MAGGVELAVGVVGFGSDDFGVEWQLKTGVRAARLEDDLRLVDAHRGSTRLIRVQGRNQGPLFGFNRLRLNRLLTTVCRADTECLISKRDLYVFDRPALEFLNAENQFVACLRLLDRTDADLACVRVCEGPGTGRALQGAVGVG